MKERKPEEISRNLVVRKAFLERERVAGDARQLLNTLETALAERERALKLTADRCSRLSESVRMLVQNSNFRCLGSDPSLLARQVLEGRDLEDIMREESRDPMLAKFYKSIDFGSSLPDTVVDPDDSRLFQTWNGHRGAIEILQTAVRLQKKTVRDLNKTAMAKFSAAVSPSRVATVRRVLELLAELRSATAAEAEISRGLDSAELEELRPRPWPIQPLSSDAITFLLDSVAAGMINAAELRDLQPEQVTPPAAPQEQGEPYLQGAI